MAALTDTFENKLIDFLFRGQALGLANSTAAAGTGPTNIYVGLFTAAPTDSTAGTEVSGGSYARVAVAASLANWAGTQAAASTVASTGSSGTTSNNGAVTFASPAASWGTVVAAGLFDSLTGGTLLAYGALGTSKTVNNGDAAPSFAAAQLTFQIDN
jgi:hypothetical protein